MQEFASGCALDGHALYLDIDGTLLDIAATPTTVHVPAGLLAVLERLHARLGGAVAFVSGRTISEIDRLFHPLRLPAVGVHGGQIRTGEQAVTVDEGLAEQLQQAVPYLRTAVAGLAGVSMENKHSAIALHYRGAPERGRQVLHVAELALAGLGAQFGIVVGKCVVELRPRQCNKGSALERLAQRAPFRGRTPVFAGDDTTDEDAFEYVNRVGGVSLRVGPAGVPTAATCRLADPQALRGWLAQVAQA